MLRYREFGVSIPAYVYDLWLPLIGPEAIGIYGTYLRLSYNNKAVFHIGANRLNHIHAMLEECGFITIERPNPMEKRKGFTSRIIVQQPPREVSKELIAKYGNPDTYQVLTPWFLEEEGEGIKPQMGFKSGFGPQMGSKPRPQMGSLIYLSIYNQESLEEQSRNREPASRPAMSSPMPYLDIPALQADLSTDRSGEQRVVETSKGYKPVEGDEQYTAFERWMLAQRPRTRRLSEQQRQNCRRRVFHAPKRRETPSSSYQSMKSGRATPTTGNSSKTAVMSVYFCKNEEA